MLNFGILATLNLFGLCRITSRNSGHFELRHDQLEREKLIMEMKKPLQSQGFFSLKAATIGLHTDETGLLRQDVRKETFAAFKSTEKGRYKSLIVTITGIYRLDKSYLKKDVIKVLF